MGLPYSWQRNKRTGGEYRGNGVFAVRTNNNIMHVMFDALMVTVQGFICHIQWSDHINMRIEKLKPITPNFMARHMIQGNKKTKLSFEGCRKRRFYAFELVSIEAYIVIPTFSKTIYCMLRKYNALPCLCPDLETVKSKN